MARGQHVHRYSPKAIEDEELRLVSSEANLVNRVVHEMHLGIEHRVDVLERQQVRARKGRRINGLDIMHIGRASLVVVLELFLRRVVHGHRLHLLTREKSVDAKSQKSRSRTARGTGETRQRQWLASRAGVLL